MTKAEVIAELETILHETELPPRFGKYVYGDRANWFFRKGRVKLEKIVKKLKNG